MHLSQIKFRYVFKTCYGRIFTEYFFLSDLEGEQFKSFMFGLNDVKIIARNMHIGKVDCKNIPIYEGDLVKYNYPYWSKDHGFAPSARKIQKKISKVIFKDGHFCLDDKFKFFDHKINEWEFEVVGNVYENPTLIAELTN